MSCVPQIAPGCAGLGGLASRWVLGGIYALAVMGQEHTDDVCKVLCVLDICCQRSIAFIRISKDAMTPKQNWSLLQRKRKTDWEMGGGN